MQRCLLLLACLLWMVWVKPVQAQGETPTPGDISILSPIPGSALQGSVAIQGSLPAEGFQLAEISFTYAASAGTTPAGGANTSNWFPIQQITQPVSEGLLAQWDTTTISDGVYDLRLVVIRTDGSQTTVTTAGLRVRNYTPIESDTPTPVLPTGTPVPGVASGPGNTQVANETSQPAATVQPTQTPGSVTPTPLPPNPAQLSTANVWTSLEKGALAAIGIFSVMGIYVLLRSILTRG